MTYFVSVGRKTLLNQLQVMAGAGSAWLLDGRSFSAQERRANMSTTSRQILMTPIRYVARPLAGLPVVMSDSRQAVCGCSVISPTAVGVAWRRHVTRGCGSPVALHTSVTSSPSSTMTSSLDHASAICGDTTQPTNRAFSVHTT